MAYNGKYAKPSAPAGLILMRIALVLMCLVVLSVHLMSGLLAKYSSTGSGSDSARVAKFQVVVTGEETDLKVQCGEDPENGTYTIRVDNQSEVTVAYTVSVEIVYPEGFDQDLIDCQISPAEATLGIGDAEKEHTLVFTVKNWEKITKYMSGQKDSLDFTFVVTVKAFQVD